MEYTSTLTYNSEACPGVRFTIRRVSFAARLDLLRRLREHGSKLEYLQGGSTTPDHLESAILEREIEEMLVRWGLASVEHLNIDGVPAEPLKLVSSGPESLVREVASRLRAQLGITEEERKNFSSHSTSNWVIKPGGDALNVGDTAWTGTGAADGATTQRTFPLGWYGRGVDSG